MYDLNNKLMTFYKKDVVLQGKEKINYSSLEH